MDNDSLIFTNDSTQQFNKHTKRILTARILIFILAAICLFMASIGFILEPHHPDEREDAIVLLILFGSMSLIYLVSGVISIRKPFTPFIITAILTVLFLMLFVYGSLTGLLYDSNVAEISAYCITAVLLLVSIFFIVRGAIYVKKHNLALIYSQLE